VTYASLEFGNPQMNPNVAVHFARQEEAREMLNAERDITGYKGQTKAPAKKTARR
jgi:hypothetical protein